MRNINYIGEVSSYVNPLKAALNRTLLHCTVISLQETSLQNYIIQNDISRRPVTILHHFIMKRRYGTDLPYHITLKRCSSILHLKSATLFYNRIQYKVTTLNNNITPKRIIHHTRAHHNRRTRLIAMCND